ncbi:hypothetical protein ACHWQZ_G007722 [Mnemiopsis leidyi]
MDQDSKGSLQGGEDDIADRISKMSLHGTPKKPKSDLKRTSEDLNSKLAQYNDPNSRTVVVYDLDMALHKNIFSRMHPERPERIVQPLRLLVESRLMSRLRTVTSREVTRDEALTVHTPEHWNFLEMLKGMTNRDLYKEGEELDSVYLSNDSFRSAKLAAGSLLAITEEVLTDRAMNGVAVIRPPGHHCKAEKPMGFCLLGNVPIACKFAMEKYGVERILIVDWDVHHGNGTQDMFLEDRRIFYMSLHRHDHGYFYPCTGDPNVVGTGDGVGYNLNIAWNESRKGDGDYLQAFYDLILPLASRYQPQLVFISAGFDSGLGDPLGNCCVTSECYGIMTQHLMSVCKGKVILALEGGYNLTTVSEGIKACCSVLLGDYPNHIDPENCVPSPGGIESINTAGEKIAPYWDNLVRFRKPEDERPVKEEAVSIHEYQEESRNNHSSINNHPATNHPANNHPPANNPVNQPTETVSQPTAEDLSFEDRVMAEMAESSNAKEIVEVSEEPQVFAVHPKTWCEHLAEHVRPAPLELSANPPCTVCQDSAESWFCLTCYQPFCSRYVKEHGLLHALDATHLMTLSMSDLSVWCYGCDAYVHNEVLLDAKNKGHMAKFGEPAVKIELAAIAED